MNEPESLADRACVPCQGGVPPLRGEEVEGLLAQLDGWQSMGDHHIEKDYRFPDFVQALAFVNRVGAVAEESGHHPAVYLAYGRVRLELWTHKIDGLTESDFVLAAKCDRALGGCGRP